MSRGKKGISACIDLGSSYFRLLVAEIASDRKGTKIVPFFEDVRYVGWGAEVRNAGAVSAVSIERAAVSLAALIDVSASMGCEEPVLAGTSVFRKAGNAGHVRSLIEKRVSIPIMVLSEMGEAALGFEGAASILEAGQRACVIDIGGTSTEIGWGVNSDFENYQEIPLGTHEVFGIGIRFGKWLEYRFIRRNFLHYLEAACHSTFSTLKGLSSLPFEVENSTIIATGGTAVSAAVILSFMLVREPGINGMRISREKMGLMIRRTSEALKTGRYRSLPVPPERADLLMPGLVLLEAVIDSLGADSIRVTERDMRWGVLMSKGSLPGRFVFDG